MSEKEIKAESKTENTQDTEQKIVTRYDLKVQRRKAQKAKAKRDRLVGNILGVIIVAALVCLVASFPIRTYLAVHETYAKVNGRKISRVEFDYNYHVALNNYLNQYGSYMSMLGLDLSGDLSQQMYSEDLTFEDYFTQLAIENITNNEALLTQARAESFVYDTAEDYNTFEENLESAAADAGMTVKAFVRDNYGDYATLSRISGFVQEAMYASAYYDALAESKMPTDEEAQEYYNEHPEEYDSVDYRLLTIDAELSEEPGEEETAAAMAAARDEADEAVKTVAQQGELNENMTKDSVPYLLEEWLFDSARKAGDTTVVENTSGNSYYVAAFEDRYRDETPTVDVRVAATDEGNGQAILDEWSAGEATEESFGEICDKYNDPQEIAAEGGLLENVQPAYLSEEMSEWLSDSARVKGDTTVISPQDDEYSYVLYFIGQSDPWWLTEAKNTLLTENLSAYMEELKAAIPVEDPKGNLKYLQTSSEDESEDASEDAAGGSSAEASGEDAGSDAADDSQSSAESGSVAQ